MTSCCLLLAAYLAMRWCGFVDKVSVWIFWLLHTAEQTLDFYSCFSCVLTVISFFYFAFSVAHIWSIHIHRGSTCWLCDWFWVIVVASYNVHVWNTSAMQPDKPKFQLTRHDRLCSSCILAQEKYVMRCVVLVGQHGITCTSRQARHLATRVTRNISASAYSLAETAVQTFRYKWFVYCFGSCIM